jgi:hypothetical protein
MLKVIVCHVNIKRGQFGEYGTIKGKELGSPNCPLLFILV